MFDLFSRLVDKMPSLQTLDEYAGGARGVGVLLETDDEAGRGGLAAALLDTSTEACPSATTTTS
jgi:hypothetical protein